jgi:hypothetical protein
MSLKKSPQLAPIFRAVEAALAENRAALNQADAYNGNHGDHMVAIFDLATRSAQEASAQELAGKGGEFAATMAYAGKRLAQLEDNGSAQVYARGLQCVAEQLGERGIILDELVAYVNAVLSDDDSAAPERAGEILRALVSGIAAWNRQESGETAAGGALNMGALFDFGIAYLGARQRGGTRIEILADAAASVSPLARVPHRLESGKLVMAALLGALKSQAGDPPQSG